MLRHTCLFGTVAWIFELVHKKDKIINSFVIQFANGGYVHLEESLPLLNVCK